MPIGEGMGTLAAEETELVVVTDLKDDIIITALGLIGVEWRKTGASSCSSGCISSSKGGTTSLLAGRTQLKYDHT